MNANSLTNLQKILAKNVKSRRKALGLSQERLALDAEIDRTYISQIERGISNPSLLVLVKIADRLDSEVVTLLSVLPDRHPQT